MSKAHAQLSDLPPEYRAQAEVQLGMAAAPTVIPGKLKRLKPNKTEAYYCRVHLDTRSDVTAIYYEGLTLRMANGHRYTPDFVVVTSGGIELHEVKGSYKLGSYQRARLAYDQAKVEFPCFKFVWWSKT